MGPMIKREGGSCKFQNYLAGFFDRYLSVCRADNEAFPGGFDYAAGGVGYAINGHDTFHLDEETFDEPEVSACDPDDHG